MNKNIAYLILGFAVLGGFSACTKQLVEETPLPKNTHTVYFSSGTAQTKTGITIGENEVTPDWRKTDVDDIHFYEISTSGAVAEGFCTAITPSSDNRTAHFTAEFEQEMTIIVNPGGNTSDGPLKAGSSPDAASGGADSYFYAAVVAQKVKNANTFFVPAVQNPDAETLIDPAADFLIGYSRKAYEGLPEDGAQVVDLWFDRPVVLGRLALSNFSDAGEKVCSVTIKAAGLSGSATYTGIDFENASVTFTPDTPAEGEDAALTLAYGEAGRALTDGAFDAYFVTLPGTVTIDAVVVETDQWIYTKTVGKSSAFDAQTFKNLKLDLSTATKETAIPTEVKWYKASVLEDGVSYLIVSAGQALKNNDGSTAAVSVTDNGGVITFEGKTDPALVWKATAHQEMTGDNGQGGVVAGHFTLTNDGTYLLRDSQEITLGDAIPSAKPKYAVWDYDGSYLKHESSETMTFYCYYDGGWATGYTQNGGAPGSSIKTVQIYTSLTPQELTFTPAANAEYDLATSEWKVAVPTLNGAQTSVTYALSDDSNPAVATVEADGTVHPLSTGTVKVVATAAGNAQYQAAAASYTLKVVNSNIQATRYVLANTIEAGKNYLVVSGGQALKNNGGNVASFAVTPSDGVIEIESGMEADLVWMSKAESGYTSNGHFSLSNGGYRMNRVSSSGNFSLSLVDATSAMDKYGVWDLQTYNGNTYLFHDSSDTMRLWVYYDGGWKVTYVQNSTNPTSTEKPTQLYVEDDGRLPQTPSFSPTEVNYDMAGSDALVKPTLSNAIGTVTYSSSNEAIATVDSDSGDVTVKKAGTVEITASAAGDSQYKPGSASYSLVITDSNNPVTGDTYVKVTSSSDLVAGAKYILVYEDGSKVFKPTLNGSNFTTTGNALDATISGGTIVSSDFKDCQMTLEDGYYLYVASVSRYLYPTYSNMGAEETKSSSHSFNISISDGIATISRTSNNSTYNLRYSSSSGYFQSSTSAANVALYKLMTEGSNPGGGDEPGGGDDPAPELTTYYPVSSIEAGKQYLIVSNGYLLDNTGSAGGAVAVTVSGNEIQVAASETMLWTATASSGKFTLGNGGSYINRSSTTFSISSSSVTWSCDSDGKLTTEGSSSTYYLYYSTSQSKWSVSNSASDSHTARLYTANPG